MQTSCLHTLGNVAILHLMNSHVKCMFADFLTDLHKLYHDIQWIQTMFLNLCKTKCSLTSISSCATGGMRICMIWQKRLLHWKLMKPQTSDTLWKLRMKWTKTMQKTAQKLSVEPCLKCQTTLSVLWSHTWSTSTACTQNVPSSGNEQKHHKRQRIPSASISSTTRECQKTPWDHSWAIFHTCVNCLLSTQIIAFVSQESHSWQEWSSHQSKSCQSLVIAVSIPLHCTPKCQRMKNWKWGC